MRGQRLRRIRHPKESRDRSLRSPRRAARCSPRRGACCSSPPALDDAALSPRARVDPHARGRFRRPLFPVFADGELEPRGRHRQVGLVHHRPRRRHPRGARREAGVRVLRRHHARGARTRRRSPRARSAARGSRRSRRSAASARARSLYAPQDPVASLPEEAKVALLERLERMARARDPRVAQVMASLAGEYEAVLIARSDGLIAADVRPLVRVSLTVIVEEDGRREQGYAGGGGRFDYGYFTDAVLDAYAAQAVGQALLNLGARDAPAGTMTVVLGPRLAGHPAARGDRPRPRRRLQPQGHERVLGPRRPARRGQGHHGHRRRHDRRGGAARSTSTTRAIRRSARC